VKSTLKRRSKELEIVKGEPYEAIDRDRELLPSAVDFSRRDVSSRNGRGVRARQSAVGALRPVACQRGVRALRIGSGSRFSVGVVRGVGGGLQGLGRSKARGPGRRRGGPGGSAGGGKGRARPRRRSSRKRADVVGGSGPFFLVRASRRRWRNGFVRPVLEHGPRSLTRTRVFGRENPARRSESETAGRLKISPHRRPVPWPRGSSRSVRDGTRKTAN